MCGIAGIISLNQSKVGIDELKKMTNAIKHRGPDGDGHWTSDSGIVGLGHRRLSIIDLSHEADQPMHFNERYTIVFNGEIYNYIEIRERLKSKGYVFKTQSDTEVLMALYDEKKEKCLDELDGMFAFVIWDSFEKRIFAARDRFGEKPFYYAIHGGRLYFASEMKALWTAGVPRDVDNEMMYNFIQYSLIHHLIDNSRTFFKGIFKLKAAHYFFLDSSQNIVSVDPIRYWIIPEKPTILNISDEEALEQFRSLLFTSIKRRLRSDVPVGSSLSGGLDSSSIVCIINEINKSNKISQNTFSACFPGFEKDETKFIEMIVNNTNVKPHYVYPAQADFLENFETLIHHQEEPFGSGSIYAQFTVMKSAKENNVTVLLDGQGADEMLGGYHYYYNTYYRELESSKISGSDTIENLTTISGVNHNTSAAKRALRNAIVTYLPFVHKPIRALIHWYNSPKSESFNQDFYNTFAHIDKGFPDHMSLYDHLRYDLSFGNLENLLRFADRNSMANSREVRLPYLSHELCEFLMQLPSNFKIRNGWTKWIQRSSLESLMPTEITWRKDKIGYEPPQKAWMDDPYFKEMIISSKKELYRQGIITKAEANKPPQSNSAHTRGDNSWNFMMAGRLFSYDHKQ